jgi:hypothetical protein
VQHADWHLVPQLQGRLGGTATAASAAVAASCAVTRVPQGSRPALLQGRVGGRRPAPPTVRMRHPALQLAPTPSPATAGLVC